MKGLSKKEIDKEILSWRFRNFDDYYVNFTDSLLLYFGTLSKLYTSDCLVAEILLLDAEVIGPQGQFKYKIKFPYSRLWGTQLRHPQTAGIVKSAIRGVCKDKNRIIIGVCSYANTKWGHAMAFVFNRKTKVFYFYDPHGRDADKRARALIKQHTAERIFDATAFVDVGKYMEGIQNPRVTKQIEDITGFAGFCAAFAALFVETALILGPRYLSLYNIAREMQYGDDVSRAVRLLRFVRHVIDNPTKPREKFVRRGDDMERDLPVPLAINMDRRREIEYYDTIEEAMQSKFKAEFVSTELYKSVEQAYYVELVTKEVFAERLYDYRHGIVSVRPGQQPDWFIETPTGNYVVGAITPTDFVKLKLEAENEARELAARMDAIKNPPQVYIGSDLKEALETFFDLLSPANDWDTHPFFVMPRYFLSKDGNWYKVSEIDSSEDFLEEWEEGDMPMDTYNSTMGLIQVNGDHYLIQLTSESSDGSDIEVNLFSEDDNLPSSIQPTPAASPVRELSPSI